MWGLGALSGGVGAAVLKGGVKGVRATKWGKAVKAMCSFAATTLVLMSDGTHQPISDIEVGDEVIATDPETGEQATKRVDAVVVHADTLPDCLVRRVDTPSGRFVFRVHFDRTRYGFRDDVVHSLTQRGALVEWSSPSMFAVDVRDAAHGQEIADFLFDRERRGQLLYETGKSA